MEEILHHLTCMKPCKKRYIYNINWCRISSINSISTCLGSVGHTLDLPFVFKIVCLFTKKKLPEGWKIQVYMFSGGNTHKNFRSQDQGSCSSTSKYSAKLRCSNGPKIFEEAMGEFFSWMQIDRESSNPKANCHQ